MSKRGPLGSRGARQVEHERRIVCDRDEHDERERNRHGRVHDGDCGGHFSRGHGDDRHDHRQRTGRDDSRRSGDAL